LYSVFSEISVLYLIKGPASKEGVDMPGIKHFMYSFWGMIMFCTGAGGVLFGIAMADLAHSPIPLVLVPLGAVWAVGGRACEKRADARLDIETAKK
jgi:hypothetical protein